MQTTMCSRCGKNVAVIFITKIEGNGQTKNEGLCLKCARELHIKPVDDIMNRFGISDEDLDSISGEAMNFLSGMEGEPDSQDDSSSSEDEGKTATFPFFGRLFGNMGRIKTPDPTNPQNRRRILPALQNISIWITTALTSQPVPPRVSSMP